ncbi:hypothetical protein DNL40_02265 [Xylanimonas oleitrophica]|uniref:Uncharacterized protein n=1 Tax=Xylanimonas oleitrophica TaxID=2607479 RepID=A0A2W5Y9B3_9MICO|nr:hypothetical protein [Xylanimonas oleitrophica]PZR55214.1 hypothetical protein DNL40_02265 [Xylanimonas oleitrophica]
MRSGDAWRLFWRDSWAPASNSTFAVWNARVGNQRTFALDRRAGLVTGVFTCMAGTLQPGDVVCTGIPEGFRPLRTQYVPLTPYSGVVEPFLIINTQGECQIYWTGTVSSVSMWMRGGVAWAVN